MIDRQADLYIQQQINRHKEMYIQMHLHTNVHKNEDKYKHVCREREQYKKGGKREVVRCGEIQEGRQSLSRHPWEGKRKERSLPLWTPAERHRETILSVISTPAESHFPFCSFLSQSTNNLLPLLSTPHPTTTQPSPAQLHHASSPTTPPPQRPDWGGLPSHPCLPGGRGIR